MVWTGLIIGVISFVIIGVFHPIVIKCEYYFTDKIWPVFLVGGLILCAASLFARNTILSASLAMLGFTMLWSIKELKEQTERVRKGWFPANPKRSRF
jgi:NAD kinase